MTTSSTPSPRADAARLERELLAHLGLTTQANSQDIESAHDDLVKFLEGAPHDLKAWADREIAAADEAYALLSDPTTDLAAIAAATVPAAALAADASAATVPNVIAAPGAAAAPDDEYFEELEIEPPTTRRARREAQRRAATSAPRATNITGTPGPSNRSRILLRLGIAAAAVVGVVAIVLFGYNLGSSSVPGISGSPAPEASGAAQLDQAQVAALMQKIATNPKDIASLQALGDLYFAAGDYPTAADWATKVLAVDPKNVSAMLALGAAKFNANDPATAEKQWRAVLVIDPKNVEAYYDLGFMYLAKNPPDMANVKAAWSKVIEIEPDSDIAKTVATHLQGLDPSAAPSGGASAAPSGSPIAPSSTPVQPSASPAASSPSPTPSGS